MFGSALLVAPITDQGTTFKNAYLPAGSDWYNYWTNERYHGGQIAKVDAPIDTIPLFVRAGSIVPLGSAIESTSEAQKIEKIRIYPGADADFTARGRAPGRVHRLPALLGEIPQQRSRSLPP